VGGYSVLRLNNYTLEGGEPSVFDAELGSSSEDEEEDEEDEDEDGRPAKRGRGAAAADAKRRAAAAAAAAAAARKPSKARVRSSAESNRMTNNAAIEKEMAAATPRRHATLAAHLRVLSPFIMPNVVAKLRAAAGGAAAAAHASPHKRRADAKADDAPVPTEIAASLREHQLVGFRFLHAAYENGLNPILGDEMARTHYTRDACRHGLAHNMLTHAPFSRFLSFASHVRGWARRCRPSACWRTQHMARQARRAALPAAHTSSSARSPCFPPGCQSSHAGARRCAWCAATAATPRSASACAPARCQTRRHLMSP
jgi:hypothetical protein